MPVLRIIFFCLLPFFTQPAFALDPKDLLPPEQAFKVTATANTTDNILLSWDIADGYYLYKNKIRIESKTAEVLLEEPVLPAGKIKHDQFFGDMEIYRDKLEIPVILKNPSNASALEIMVKYQGCADIGICYPPQKTNLNINLPVERTDFDPVNQIVQGLSSFKNNLFGPELLPPEEAFRFFASVIDGNTLQVHWIIAEDYYLYREKIELTFINSDNTQLGSYTSPQGIPEEDEAFGRVEIFFNELKFDIPVIRSSVLPQTVSLLAKFQGCAVLGVCYPPMQETVALELPAIQNIPNTPAAKSAPPQKQSEMDQIVQSLQHDSLWLTLLSFFGFGLLLSFTPCIFPMIPILSGIIVGQGNNVTTARAFVLSLSFVLASAATYTVFGIVAALFGSNLQATFQEPWVIFLFSSIFILLSLSMFGFYNLELPKSLQARLHNASDKHRDGSLVGAALMGSLSSLIVGPCVAAPLAGALIYIGQTGDAVLGGSALFMMGFGMGVPLLILGASAGKLLPKAGNWLKTTKAVFGVIMLAVAVWMLDRILPPSITMLLWAMLMIIPAIYLSAIDPLPGNASNWRKLWKGVGLMSLTYGVLLLIGVSMGNTNPLKPLQGAGSSLALSEQGITFQRISSIQQLEEKIRRAGTENQWVMLDFYADWCISCKEMEAYTFTDPTVKQQLSNFVLLQADVTKNSVDDKALLDRFNLIGPPAIIFFAPDQLERPELRIIGYKDAPTFIAHLQQTDS